MFIINQMDRDRDADFDKAFGAAVARSTANSRGADSDVPIMGKRPDLHAAWCACLDRKAYDGAYREERQGDADARKR